MSEEGDKPPKRLIKLSGINSFKPAQKKFAPKAQPTNLQKPPQIKSEKPQNVTKPKIVKKSPQNFKPKEKKYIQSSSVFDQGIDSGSNYGMKPSRGMGTGSEKIFEPKSSSKKEILPGDISEQNIHAEDDIDYPFEDEEDEKTSEKPVNFPFMSKNDAGGDIIDNAHYSLMTFNFPDELATKSLESGKDDSIFNSDISGKIGKLKIYKSGKKEIVIGNSAYNIEEVSSSCVNKCYIREDIMDTATKFIDIGTSSSDIVISPNIIDLINNLDIECTNL